jgi:hypothetical protein
MEPVRFLATDTTKFYPVHTTKVGDAYHARC